MARLSSLSLSPYRLSARLIGRTAWMVMSGLLPSEKTVKALMSYSPALVTCPFDSLQNCYTTKILPGLSFPGWEKPPGVMKCLLNLAVERWLALLNVMNKFLFITVPISYDLHLLQRNNNTRDIIQTKKLTEKKISGNFIYTYIFTDISQNLNIFSNKKKKVILQKQYLYTYIQ